MEDILVRAERLLRKCPYCDEDQMGTMCTCPDVRECQSMIGDLIGEVRALHAIIAKSYDQTLAQQNRESPLCQCGHRQNEHSGDEGKCFKCHCRKFIRGWVEQV